MEEKEEKQKEEKQKKERTPEEEYKLLKKSFILYALTAILTPFIALLLVITDKGDGNFKNLILLVILTEVYTISRAIFDYEEKKKMEEKLFQEEKT